MYQDPKEFLLCSTPLEWLDNVHDSIDILLIDHANAEKKAASTALSLMYRYIDDNDFLIFLSCLAREELLHFEQVVNWLDRYNVKYRYLSPGRYASELVKLISKNEPHRKVDSLIVAAIIEARSCERFEVLIDVLPKDLGAFYRKLYSSEKRHFIEYFNFAKKAFLSIGAEDDFERKVKAFLKRDSELICEFDSVFRFHSGPLFK